MKPPNDFGPVLAATDFSAPARHAADRAARLAHETGAALTLMHVVPGDAMRELSSRWGERLDCLVNNAGTDRGSDIAQVTDDEWHAVLGVNLHGPMHTSRAFVRHVIEACAGREPDAGPDDLRRPPERRGRRLR